MRKIPVIYILGYLSIALLGLPLDGNIPSPPSEIREIVEIEKETPIQTIAIWMAIYAYAFYKTAINPTQIFSEIQFPRSLKLLTLLFLISAMWSPPNTGNISSILQILGSIFISLALTKNFNCNEENLFKLVQIGSATNLGINLIAILIFPGSTIGFDGRWAGAVANPNFLGALAFLCAMSSIATYALTKGHPFRLFIFLLISGTALVGTGSITSIAAVLAGAAIAVFSATSRLKSNERLAVSLLALGIAIVSILAVYLNAETILKAVGRDSGATGRGIIWLSAIDLISQKPLFGYGMGADTLNTGALPWATHFHNSYLSVGVATGLSGILILLWFLIRQLLLAIKYKELQISKVHGAIITSIAIYCLAEAPLYLARNPVWILLLTSTFAFNQSIYFKGKKTYASPK